MSIDSSKQSTDGLIERGKDKYFRTLFPVVLLSLGVVGSAYATVDGDGLAVVGETSEPLLERCDEIVGTDAVVASEEPYKFLDIFVCGDELFEVRFNALDGGGMNVGDGGRYTRVPRMDLNNWANAMPLRATGPNASACNECHTTETIGGAGDGAGPPSVNAIRDPLRTGQPADFIQRNTPHLFGMAGLQLLAENMTERLEADKQRAISKCESKNSAYTATLRAKDVYFGTVTAAPPCATNVSVNAVGVDDDLVVRPFQWKGTIASVREFSRDAFHQEIGMTPVETAGAGVDSDFDGVTNEVSIADVTAMAVYLAAQPRPTTLLELDDLRSKLEKEQGGEEFATKLGLPELDNTQKNEIKTGERIFEDIGCASCHMPLLKTTNVTFAEPSRNRAYRDDYFPSGEIAEIPEISFDITTDMPDNHIALGSVNEKLGNFETNDNGKALVRLYGDLKRHDMGPGLAENVDEAGTGSSVWMTKELWGLANTAPYLHDGRATTIEEAILEHGGDSQTSTDNFVNLPVADRTSMLTFLKNLVLFFPSDELLE